MLRSLLVAAAVTGGVLGLSNGASAAVVTNYSWLQIPDGITASYGNPINQYQTSGGTGFGDFDYFRWGSRVWIPNNTLTGNPALHPVQTPGIGTYWTTIKLDQPRLVKTVTPQFFAADGAAIRRYKVEASLDGITYAQIGDHDFGSMQVNALLTHTEDVTDGVYQYIRIRLDGTAAQPGDSDYRYGNNTNRAGPGFVNIEVVGDGTIADSHQTNWVNQPHFLTTIANNGLDINGNVHNNGLLADNPTRTGDLGNFEVGDYSEIDLKAVRRVGRSIAVWQHVEGATSYNIQWSNDDINYFNVTGLSAAIQRAGTTTGATEYTFNPVLARYFRMNNAVGPNTIMNQWMLFNVPEPTTAGLLGLAGVALLRRRQVGR